MPEKPVKYFPVVGCGETLEGNYARVAAVLTDEELEEEILGRKGSPGFMLALLAEADRRAARPPGEE